MAIIKDVWLGADNSFTLQLVEIDPDNKSETAVDLSSVSKIELYLQSSSKHSVSFAVSAGDPDMPIDWIAQAGIGYVKFTLGNKLKELGAKATTYYAELQVYDGVNTNGLVWFNRKTKEVGIIVHPELVVP